MSAQQAWRSSSLGLAVAGGLAAASPGAAQTTVLNYESLSSIEEPLAVEVGDVTLTLTGLVDVRLTRETEGDDNNNASLLGNFQVGAATQLPNRWRVGLSYFGQHASDPTSVFGTGKGYTDNAALSVGGYWGTVHAGNVSVVVREQTRRLRGAGNASLAFDGAFGAPEEVSAGYTGRFGPWVVGAVIDKDGNPDLGAVFRRPSGNMDWRLALRASEGQYTAADDSARFDTTAWGVVGEAIYGSTAFDAGLGHERFSWRRPEAERWFLSAGVHTKTGALTFSLEGHWGEIEGEEEVSAALGLQFDLARGLSCNLGMNHARAAVILGGTEFIDIESTTTALSLRYSF